MKADELFADCRVTHSFGEREFTGVCSDSRRVKAGDLFLCQTGNRNDGHDFAAEALKNGAVGILASHPIPGIPETELAMTDDVREAESRIWNRFCGRPADGMVKIAVTGTAGKTSVVFLLRHLFRAAGYSVGVITTVGAFSGDREVSLGQNGGSSVSDVPGAMTTPDPEFFFGAVREMRDDGCGALIWEASSQSLAMKKTAAITADCAVFTNLSPEHLDCHGTVENYFAAKAGLLGLTNAAVINADDEWIARLKAMAPGKRIVTCSADPAKVARCDVCALKIASRGPDGMEYVFFSERAVFRITTPLTGRYSVYNTMQAAACALSFGIDPMTVKEALADFPGVPGRMMRVHIPGEGTDSRLPKVFIDYAHTPGALSAVLESVREWRSGGRLTVLFGCGGDRDRSKRPLMAHTAQRFADRVILTGDNPRTEDPDGILSDLRAGIDPAKPYTVIPDRAAAIRHAVLTAEEGEILLLTGKGHEKYEIRADGKHFFDEEALAREALAEKLREYGNSSENKNNRT